MVSYEEYYKRQIEQWGLDTQRKLLQKKIAIIGCGGLGSSLGFALGSSGIGEIHLVDFDQVTLGNIHRQIAFCMNDVGAYKSTALAKSMNDRNPFGKALSLVMNFDEFSNMGNEYDLILDATDNYHAREQIDLACKFNSVPWIYASVEEFNGQLCFFDKSSFSAFNHVKHVPQGIAAPMVMQIASMEANMALRYLCGFDVPKDKLHYVSYDGDGNIDIRVFTMPV